MRRQGLDGRRQKNLAFLTSKSGSPKKWFAIAHENRQNEGYARFGTRLTFKMGRTGREGQPALMVGSVTLSLCFYLLIT